MHGSNARRLGGPCKLRFRWRGKDTLVSREHPTSTTINLRPVATRGYTCNKDTLLKKSSSTLYTSLLAEHIWCVECNNWESVMNAMSGCQVTTTPSLFSPPSTIPAHVDCFGFFAYELKISYLFLPQTPAISSRAAPRRHGSLNTNNG